MQRMSGRLLLGAVLASVLCGCPSVSTMGMARTLDRGKGQLMLGAEVVSFEVPNPLDGTSLIRATLPQAEIAGRYGITDRVEVGLKAWLIGAGLDLKFALLRSESLETGVDLAIDPGFAYLGSNSGPDSSLTSATLPVLAGINLSGHQLVLGPKGVFTFARGSGSSTTSLAVGGVVGMAFRVSPGVRLMPEVTVTTPVFSSNAGASLPGLYVQGGLGLLIGGFSE